MLAGMQVRFDLPEDKARNLRKLAIRDTRSANEQAKYLCVKQIDAEIRAEPEPDPAAEQVA